MNLTARELLALSAFSYLNLPAYFERRLKNGDTAPLSAAADALIRLSALDPANSCAALVHRAAGLLNELRACGGQIVGYENQNAASGFVGYAFDIGDTRVLAFRGSETEEMCAPNAIDWRDNFCAPFAGSVQEADVAAFVRRFGAPGAILTGHSKGAHNALLGLAGAPDGGRNLTAVAFNGQGFAPDALSETAEATLREWGVNYVVSGDIVGALLKHPERRIFVKAAPGVNPHMPEAYVFDASGAPVRARRTIRQVLIGILSLWAYGWLTRGRARLLARVCEFVALKN